MAKVLGWEQVSNGDWAYVLASGRVTKVLSNAEYQNYLRKKQTAKNERANNRAEDLKIEKDDKSSTVDSIVDNIVDNKYIDNVVKIGFIFIVFKIIIGVFK